MSAFEKIGDVQFVKKNDNGYYSFKLDDDKWYGHGDVEPSFEKGDRIKFIGSTKVANGTTYYNADADSVKVKKGAGTVKPYKKSGGGGKSAESKAYWEERTKMDLERFEFEKVKHKAISELSYRNSALAYLDLLQKVGGLPLGKLKTPAAIHKAMDACLDATIEQFRGEAPVPVEATDPTADLKELEQPEDFDEPTTTTGENDGEEQEEW